MFLAFTADLLSEHSLQQINSAVNHQFGCFAAGLFLLARY